MGIDPAAGFALTPEARNAERLAALERQAAANPGAQAGGGFIAAEVRSNDWVGTAVAGPEARLTIPDGGALVQMYAELDFYNEAAVGVQNPCARVHDDPLDPTVNLGWGVGVGPPVSTTLQLASDRVNEWVRIRMPAENPAAGQSRSIFEVGTQMVRWEDVAGEHVYRLRCSTQGAGAYARYRNRRLMVRVLT